jgi:DNA polymerase II large subunit
VKRRSLGLDRLPTLIKAQKELLSEAQTPEPIEKGILRAKHGVSVFRDGTSRYDMIDVPVTHFKPKEIYTSWEKLYQLGYEKDVFGQELNSNEQILELFPQDIIPSLNAEEHLISTCNFVDDLLVRFYEMEPFYNVKTIDDIVGSLAIGLAPHTSGGVLCRIIGWTAASAGYAHPLFHAAKRRNCDGDEDSILMLMDGLLNFSKHILPSGRGGRMDAPLVLTTRLNPSEIDKEALNVDCSYYYTRSFYEKTQSQPHPSELSDEVETVETRLGTIGDLRGYGWTHESGELDAGPKNSSYKTLKSMEDKMNGQLSIGSLLRSVRVEKVASQVIESHFLPDLRGNLVAFTRQKVRCVKCGEKYRRMPLAGKCIQSHKLEIGGLSARRGEDSTMCGGNVILTVTEGAVRKYIKVTEGIIENYGVGMYTEQRVKWLTESADSLFNNDKVTVMTLSDFL